jgi:peptidoglycan pentaglycine glycine transferase (the first glycine)
MHVKLLTADQSEEWNALAVRESSFVLMQSWEWGEFKSRLGWKVFRIAVLENEQVVAGAQLLIRLVPMGLGSIAYVPRGPIGHWLDDQTASLLFSELHKISRHYRAIFLKIEPPVIMDPDVHTRLSQYGFQASTQTNQPRATLILDLTRDLGVVLKSFRKKTRQYIGNSIRAGVVVKKGDDHDISALYDLVRMTGRLEHFSTPGRRYFEQEWQTFSRKQQYSLLMAFYQDQLLAVRTVHRFGRHAAEFHAGSKGRYSHLYPNYLLTWEAITWAKNQGCETYDLWGIPDEIAQLESENSTTIPSRHDGLWGVYQFKRGFTKNIVCYLGAYDYIYSQSLFGLMSKALMKQNRRERVVHWIDLAL